MEDAVTKLARDLIASRTGLLVREESDNALLTRLIAERVHALSLSGAEQYCQFLASDQDIRHEQEALVTLLTAGETYFFRDSGQHALLQETILPELLDRRKALRSLRIWCAACSTGEEVYSLAILLDELLADQSRWDILILGTDINHSAIERARIGRYSEWSFRNTTDERRQRFFARQQNTWVLNEAIRNRVTFFPGDLMADAFPAAPYFHDMDLILCRNIFIYMVPQAVSHIADKLTETLTEGGILITGHGELYAHHLGKLRTRVYPESILYQKVSTPYQAPAAPPPTEMPRPVAVAQPLAAPVLPKVVQAAAPAPAAKSPRETAASEMLRAWQCANQGQQEKAEKICRELVAKDPLFADPHYLLALLAQERGDFETEKASIKKVIYLDSSFIAAYLDLGDLYIREGDAARARKMRITARDLLKGLPGDSQVRYYGAGTVNTVLQFVERLLDSH
ncbi:MAG: hypothetical protein PHR30_12225 [Gallionellaceae bacterium]|nr:hypothetical protein [Gallionellaceae bacterium]